MNILAVGVGGFFGAIGRYFINESISVPNGFPMATLLGNWLGCFCLAYLLTVVTKWHPRIKLAMTTGFLGAFTTFSTFSLEAFQMIKHGQMMLAIFYILSSIVGGLGFSFVGLFVAKRGQGA